MIVDFANAGTEDIWAGDDSKKARSVLDKKLWETAQELLDQIHEATTIGDLREPPSNRLHTLKDDLEGFYSVSINLKYRIIFRFADGQASSVEILDYH